MNRASNVYGAATHLTYVEACSSTPNDQGGGNITTAMEMEVEITLFSQEVLVEKAVQDLRGMTLDAEFIGLNVFAVAISDLRISIVEDVKVVSDKDKIPTGRSMPSFKLLDAGPWSGFVRTLIH